MCMLVSQSSPTLCDPRDCSPPGSSVYGILQARILESVSFSRDPEIEPGSPALQADSLPSEPPGKLECSLQINDLRALPNSYPEGKILKPIYKKVSYVALPNLHRRAHSRRLSLKVTPLKRLLEKQTHRPLSVWLWLNSA